jgi:DNA-binding protein HU-beta
LARRFGKKAGFGGRAQLTISQDRIYFTPTCWRLLRQAVPLSRGFCAVNKNDLCVEVAKKTGMSKADVGKAVDATLEAIMEALKKNDDVRLVGFGTYSVTERSATEGRNPRTGQPIRIPASKRAKFKPGKGLNDALN